MKSYLYRLLVSHGASAFATGVHVVLLSWLAVGEFKLDATQLAWIQASVLIPNLALMLFAGVLADRHSPALIAVAAQGAQSVCYLGLLASLLYFESHYSTLLFYGVCVGVSNAFIQPAREKLLSVIARDTLQKRISLFSIVQFSAQSAGIALAALSDSFGVLFVLAVQCFFSFASCVSYFRLRSIPIARQDKHAPLINDVLDTGAYVLKRPALLQLMGLVAFNGYMHMGVFLVMIPVVATKIYDFSASEYAFLQLLFVFGMISANILILKKRLIEYPGQGALFSLLYTALIGFGLVKQPTPFGFYMLVFFWGLVAGNSASRCRMVLRIQSSSQWQGRLMSLYQLLLFGTAPIGALVTGYVLHFLDTNTIFTFMSVSSVILFAFFMLTRSLWRVVQDPD